MKHLLQKWNTYRKGWFFFSLGMTLLISVPLIYLVLQLFKTNDETISILQQNFTSDSVYNTLKLVVFTSILTFVFGVSTAYLVTCFRFPFRKFFDQFLILPIAIPGYIMAVTYSGIFDYAGPVQNFFRNNYGEATAKSWYFDIMSMPFLIIILSLSLYPYVYITSRNAFKVLSSNYLEVASSMGKTRTQVFFKIILPLALPSILAGVWLVVMEVLNDYGAASYFGIRTLTTEIFRAWKYDLNAALIISAGILLIIFLLLFLQRRIFKNRKVNEANKPKPLEPKKLSGWKGILAFTICLLPLLFGFIIPFAMLVKWAIQNADTFTNNDFLEMTYNSMVLAFWAASFILLIAVITNYAFRINRIHGNNVFSLFSSLGYAIPGAVIAIAVLGFSLGIDKYIFQSPDLVLTGSILMLIFAYIVRFLAVAQNPVREAFEKNSGNITQAGQSLGHKTWRTLFFLDLPLIKNALLGIFLLIFIDVLKELPLTLILRPFNFETLSTTVYGYAKVNESVEQAAPAAVIIVFLGIIPVLLLNRLLNKNDKAKA